MGSDIGKQSGWWIPVISLTLVGCEPAKEPNRPTVSLRIRGGPPAATVVIDDEPLGSLEFVAAHGVALPPGIHHVTVTARGYFPWDREVDARLGAAPIALEVALTPIPD
ncbi:MAG TPA: PEGA domain-containing protein [Polyangiaceae bacterium]|nr:PEGA domain-containing protein [Polyangiaceae bacterium]